VEYLIAGGEWMEKGLPLRVGFGELPGIKKQKHED